jgi:phosphonatase-like hydrolase
MSPIRLAVFDLAGTTVYDDNFVARCLHRAARDCGIDATEEEIGRNIGTNKRDLYRMLIARSQGTAATLDQLGTIAVADADAHRAEAAFELYERYMLELYRTECREIPGAADVFRWLHDRGVKVATDTGFHRTITDAIMDRLGWLRDGLVDAALCVQDIPGERGRPAPYMIFAAMQRLGVMSVGDVVKLGDQPADLLEGMNAGCRGVIGVLSGPLDAVELGAYRHTHIIPSVADLPRLVESEGWL